MVLVHEDDLERIDRIGGGTVDGHSIVNHIILPMLAVARIPPARNDDESSLEVQGRDT
jgi:hypothetical protein